MSQPPVHGAQPAHNLQKKYDVVSMLGAGGFGKVYLLKHKQTYQLRAVKCQVLLKPFINIVKSLARSFLVFFITKY
jgi:hypothetical protein